MRPAGNSSASRAWGSGDCWHYRMMVNRDCVETIGRGEIYWRCLDALSRPLAPSFCKMPVTIKRLQRVLEQVKIYEVSDEVQR